MNWSAFEPRGKPVKVRILCWEEEHARLSQASTAEPESAHTDQDARVLGRVFFLVGGRPGALEWQLAPMTGPIQPSHSVQACDGPHL
jgi:hypothetical protein